MTRANVRTALIGRGASLLAASLALHSSLGSAFAQAPQPPSAPSALPPGDEAGPSEADKEEARRQFEKGVVLLKEEAWSAALAAFLRSRELFPTRGNTKNAAFCLRKLQRYDESLDMYEALLRDFPNLSPEDKLEAQTAASEMRGLVGTIDIAGAEPGAAITVDGQTKGDYPPVRPIRAAAGSHIVRVYKEGFEPFETRVDVAGGQSSTITAKLRALQDAGRLKVVEQSGRSLDLVIDGTVRGQTPWEGKLEVGPHMVFLRGKGTAGTQPASVVIRSQQTASLSLRAEELDASIRVEPRPISARVAIDGVTLGSGPWALRLKSGRHRVEVFEEGFLSSSREVTLGRGDRQILPIDLGRDPKAARWQKPSKWAFELGAGFAMVPSLGGDVAGACTGNCARTLGAGGVGIVHAGYELGWGLGFGIEAGYLAAFQSVERRQATITPVGLPEQPGVANDALRLDGFVVGATGSIRFGDRIPFGFRLGAGALLGGVRDERSGRFTARDGSPITAHPVADRQQATFVYLAPEFYLGARIGKQFEIGGSVAAYVLIAPSQPRWDPTIETSAGSDGRGSYGDDALTGAAIPVFVPSLRARYEM
jgi:hypothetical protein